ncbi:MAG TPA: hypothetical protein VGF14_08000 [Alphaproteobacteria bacterium]
MKHHAYLSPHTLNYRLQTGQFLNQPAFNIYEVESSDPQPKYVIGVDYRLNVRDIKDMGVIKKPIQSFTYKEARLMGDSAEKILSFLGNIGSEQELTECLALINVNKATV